MSSPTMEHCSGCGRCTPFHCGCLARRYSPGAPRMIARSSTLRVEREVAFIASFARDGALVRSRNLRRAADDHQPWVPDASAVGEGADAGIDGLIPLPRRGAVE